MIKHRGFPSRLPGTDYHFTIRRESREGATPLSAANVLRIAKPQIAAQMQPSWRRCGSILARPLSSGEISMQVACHGSSGAKSSPPKTRLIQKAMMRFCGLMWPAHRPPSLKPLMDQAFGRGDRHESAHLRQISANCRRCQICARFPA